MTTPSNTELLDCSDLTLEQVGRIFEWHAKVQQKLLKELLEQAQTYEHVMAGSNTMVTSRLTKDAVPLEVIQNKLEGLS